MIRSFSNLLSFALEASIDDPFEAGSNIEHPETPFKGEQMPVEPRRGFVREVRSWTEEGYKYNFFTYDVASPQYYHEVFFTRDEAIKWLFDNGYQIGSYIETFEDEDIPTYPPKSVRWIPWSRNLIDEHLANAELSIAMREGKKVSSIKS